jgi:hypothetical protein
MDLIELPDRVVDALPVVLDPVEHAAAIDAALSRAELAGLLNPSGPVEFLAAGVRPRSWSLAADQTPFQNQGDRGSCWAFAGASALEAAYRRRFGLTLDISEEYVFHMGKAFALNRTSVGGPVVMPVENNTTLTGFQGSGDIAQKLSENAVPDEGLAPYLSQSALTGILPVLGFPNVGSLVSQEDYDAIEFCEQHVPVLARVNCRYRASGFATIGGSPSIEALENVILSNREVICDVQHLTSPVGGHVLTLVGFDSDRRVFQAKNHWGENAFIEIAYENDPNWQILSGWYLTGVVDPTFVQNQACWLGNWSVSTANGEFRMLLRRSEDFAAPGAPTRLGHAYLADGRHDVNGHFSDNGRRLTAVISAGTGATMPGDERGLRLVADFDFADVYEQNGTADGPVGLSRYRTRFAALFVPDGGQAWQARHGIDGAAYQALFDTLPGQGFRPVALDGYSQGRGARFNAVWVRTDGPAWAARHGLTGAEYQVAFDELVGQGFHPVMVSGYAENGAARYAALFEQGPVEDWQARHGLSAAEYQASFDAMTADGFVPVHVSGYRVNLGVQFAAIWRRLPGVEFIGRHGLTSTEYQAAFDEALAGGFRLVCVDGYSAGGIARYAAIWHRGAGVADGPWQARHGLDAVGYQHVFDNLAGQGLRPAIVSGYGDGFHPA